MASVLGIDTSAAACSVAVWRDGAVLAAARLAMTRGHAEALMPMIEKAMHEAGLAYGDLAAVAAVRGPGAFTGIRIGLAAARGLALAANIPAIGISTFDAVAAAVPEAAREGRVLVVAIDTKRADLYRQCYDSTLQPLGDAGVVAPGEAAASLAPGQLCLAGDGAEILRAALASRAADIRMAAFAPPDAAIVAQLGAAALARGAPFPPPEPLYLRAPEATPLALQRKQR